MSYNLFHTLCPLRGAIKLGLEGSQTECVDTDNDGRLGRDRNVCLPYTSCSVLGLDPDLIEFTRLMGIVQNFNGLFAARFFIGMAEVGFHKASMPLNKTLTAYPGRLLSRGNVPLDSMVGESLIFEYRLLQEAYTIVPHLGIDVVIYNSAWESSMAPELFPELSQDYWHT